MVEHSKAYEKAKEFYPTRWSKEDLLRLVNAGKLTEEEYYEIVGYEDDIES